MNQFATFQIINYTTSKKLDKVPKHEEFWFTLRDDQHKLNWEANDKGSSVEIHKIPTEEDIQRYSVDSTVGKEIIINCQDIEMARNIQTLIYCGSLLVCPNVTSKKCPPFVYLVEDTFNWPEIYLKHHADDDLIYGCDIAVKAWGHKELIYSLLKYKFSLELDSISPHSGNPIYGQVFNNFYSEYNSIVGASFAILSAYQVIEELGLDIRSSSQKQRFYNNSWNPKVKEDITGRLGQIGISEEDDITWILRGEETSLQSEIKPVLGDNTQYNDGIVYRDIKMKIYDAIHYASYIRNFFVAHKFSDITRYLSPYDIHNVQQLARRLLLSKFDFWNKQY